MGIALAERSALIPLFDRRSLPAYSIIAAMFCIGVPFALLRGFTISPAILSGVPLIMLWIVSAGLLRRIGRWKLATWLEAQALVYGQALPAFVILIPATALFPIADAKLAAMDRALGFDWVATVYALRPYTRLLWIAYTSFQWQPSLALLLLAAFDPDRCWKYVTAGLLCMFVICLVFPFFPAYGAFHYYGIEPKDYPPFTYETAPWSWRPGFDRLREGYKVVDFSVWTALVSFPSYHAAAGTLTVWAAWPFRYFRYPALVLNAGLFAGALVFGTHHGIDLLAGSLMALAAVYVLTRLKTLGHGLAAPIGSSCHATQHFDTHG